MEVFNQEILKENGVDIEFKYEEQIFLLKTGSVKNYFFIEVKNNVKIVHNFEVRR